MPWRVKSPSDARVTALESRPELIDLYTWTTPNGRKVSIAQAGAWTYRIAFGPRKMVFEIP